MSAQPEENKSRTRTAYGSAEVVAETPDHNKVNLKLDHLRLCSSGMFSNVYRGKIVGGGPEDPESIAVKKTWAKANSNLTEVRILARLNKRKHKNIVHLLYYFQSDHSDKTCYGLVFEYLPSNLYTYIREMRKKNDGVPDMIEVKLMAWQMFRGQAHLSAMKIVHRDIKPQNILVNPDSGLLKIGDFGSSKFYTAGETSHSYHVTRYYRAPELILGATQYGPEIDVWSCGCVFGELLRGGVIWPGGSTAKQLYLICNTLGRPSHDEFVAMKAKNDTELNSAEIQKYYKNPAKPLESFKKLMPHAPPKALELIAKILRYNPARRGSGATLLKHTFFSQLFEKGTLRSNGKPITVVGPQDLTDAVHGDLAEESSQSRTTSHSLEFNDL